MIVTNVKIKFPVLLYTNHHIRGRIKDVDELVTVSKGKLSEGCFNGSNLIDSNGNQFVVLSAIASKKDRVPFLRNLIEGFGFVKADIELSESNKVSLDEVKKILIDVVVGNKMHQGSQLSAKDIIAAVNNAMSYEELINSFSYLVKRTRRH